MKYIKKKKKKKKKSNHIMAATLSLHPLAESDIPNRMDTDPALLSSKKKRKSDVTASVSKKPKTRESLGGSNGKYCHQCHQVREVFVECTVLTTRGKKTERCGKIFWYFFLPSPSSPLLDSSDKGADH